MMQKKRAKQYLTIDINTMGKPTVMFKFLLTQVMKSDAIPASVEAGKYRITVSDDERAAVTFEKVD